MNGNRLSAMGRQSGASPVVVLIIVLFFGGLLTMGLKLGPDFLDDVTIQEAVEGIRRTEGLSRMGAEQVRQLINKRLIVNNVRSLKPDDIIVEKKGNVVFIKVDYEVRNNLFRNVDTIIHFQHEYEMRGQ